MRRAFLIHSITGFKGWETCLRFVMEKADTFRIIFQGRSNVLDAEGLNAGKKEFLTIPSITVTSYEGMQDSIEVTGKLNNIARELFLFFMEPSFHGLKSDLWSFQFLKGNDVMLRLEDFTVCLLFLEESELEVLHAQGVDGPNLQEINSVWT